MIRLCEHFGLQSTVRMSEALPTVLVEMRARSGAENQSDPSGGSERPEGRVLFSVNNGLAIHWPRGGRACKPVPLFRVNQAPKNAKGVAELKATRGIKIDKRWPTSAV